MRLPILTLLLSLGALESFCQSLTRTWSTDTLFLKPESAVYDKKKDVIYISNVNGDFLARDNNGFISIIKTDGKIQTLKWITGLDNPQGMGLYQNKLYVADIDRVVQINVDQAKIEHIYKIEGAVFLNDVSIDRKGDLYVSDCRTNKIHRISGDKIETWLADSLLSVPNGLLALDDRVFVLNMKNGLVYSVDKTTKKLSGFTSGITDCDGIVSDGKDGYFVSGAWQGSIYHLNAKGEKKLILDLRNEKVITADIAYLPQQKLLIIPTLNKTVIAYKWN